MSPEQVERPRVRPAGRRLRARRRALRDGRRAPAVRGAPRASASSPASSRDQPVPLGAPQLRDPAGARRAGHADARQGADAAADGARGRSARWRRCAAARSGRRCGRRRWPQSAGRRSAAKRNARSSLRAYARVEAGRGLIVAVTGEPGIGKTSLVEDFLRSSRRAASGRRSRAADVRRAWPAPRRTCRFSRCSTACCTGRRAVARLADQDGRADLVRAGRRRRSAESRVARRAARAAPAASQERMKRELGALLQEISRVAAAGAVHRRPALGRRLDDRHAELPGGPLRRHARADPHQLPAVGHGAGEASVSRRSAATCSRAALFEEIGLGFLEAGGRRALSGAAVPGPRVSAATSPRSIHAKTEGSPLFMADLVRYLRDTGGDRRRRTARGSLARARVGRAAATCPSRCAA